MTTAQAFLLAAGAVACLVVGVVLIRAAIMSTRPIEKWRARRDRAIEEHTDEFWRQVG